MITLQSLTHKEQHTAAQSQTDRHLHSDIIKYLIQTSLISARHIIYFMHFKSLSFAGHPKDTFVVEWRQPSGKRNVHIHAI